MLNMAKNVIACRGRTVCSFKDWHYENVPVMFVKKQGYLESANKNAINSCSRNRNLLNYARLNYDK